MSIKKKVIIGLVSAMIILPNFAIVAFGWMFAHSEHCNGLIGSCKTRAEVKQKLVGYREYRLEANQKPAWCESVKVPPCKGEGTT